MAKSDIVRFHCNYCSKEVDIPPSSNYPSGWKQFAARRLSPTESEESYTIDLCQEHANDFLDFLHGKNGPHRLKPISMKDIKEIIEQHE
jgi:hypothetical protein